VSGLKKLPPGKRDLLEQLLGPSKVDSGAGCYDSVDASPLCAFTTEERRLSRRRSGGGGPTHLGGVGGGGGGGGGGGVLGGGGGGGQTFD